MQQLLAMHTTCPRLQRSHNSSNPPSLLVLFTQIRHQEQWIEGTLIQESKAIDPCPACVVAHDHASTVDGARTATMASFTARIAIPPMQLVAPRNASFLSGANHAAQ